MNIEKAKGSSVDKTTMSKGWQELVDLIKKNGKKNRNHLDYRLPFDASGIKMLKAQPMRYNGDWWTPATIKIDNAAYKVSLIGSILEVSSTIKSLTGEKAILNTFQIESKWVICVSDELTNTGVEIRARLHWWRGGVK